jgi:LemA protein
MPEEITFMNTKTLWIGLTVLILVILCAGGFGSYNRLITLEETVGAQWSQVENQLQRRSDLIPNLVNTVSGYAAHEQSAIQAVADARSKMAGADSVETLAASDRELSGALSRLLAIVENYPDLEADTQFQSLQDELAGTENRIAVSRRDYNQSVQSYNTQIKRFPSMIFSAMLGFESKSYFQASEGADQPPEVNFGGGQ